MTRMLIMTNVVYGRIRSYWRLAVTLGLVVVLTNAIISQESKIDNNWPSLNKSIAVEVDFHLDNLFNSIYYFPINDETSFLYISSYGNPYDIFKFKIEDYVGRIEKVIRIQKEGPHGIRPGVSGFHVFSQDSIFVFGRNGQYALINEDAEILDKFKCNYWLDDKNLNAFPFLFGGITSYEINDLLVSSTNGTPDFKVKNVGSIINLRNKTCTPIMQQDAFLKGWYGDYNANALHFICADAKFIYAGPASSHLVHIIDSQRNVISSVEMSLSTLGKFKPISSKKRNVTEYQQQRHLALQGYYYELVYDKFKSRFYRRAFDKNIDFKEADDLFEYPYLLVFDESMKKTHELRIPDEYRNFRGFTSDHGLCLLNEAELDRDEEVFVFDCFLFDR